MRKNAILAGLMFLTTFASGASAWDKIEGQSNGITEKQFVVVRCESEWATLWIRHTAGRSEAMPVVDFNREMVVAVFLGERSTGGYKVEVKPIPDPISPKSRMVVLYREIAPARKNFSIQMVTRPFIMVKVRKVQKVDFEEDQVVAIPENQAEPQKGMSPEDSMHMLQSVNKLQSVLQGSPALFQ